MFEDECLCGCYFTTCNNEVVMAVYDGDPHNDDPEMSALKDAFQDEYGVRPADQTGTEEDGDAMFEIVAVPDDVAGVLGPDNGSGYAAEYDRWL